MCKTCGCGEGQGQEHGHHGHDGHDGHEGLVAVERDLLERNDRFAADNRRLFTERGVVALNLISSPGSGKTRLLERTLTDLAGRFRFAVIEGDQQTRNDAERIRRTGVPVRQINTLSACHLDAHQTGHAAGSFDLGATDILFIENVGNLVCPASFDLGEDLKVALMSVTEGEDKPEKYPLAFHLAGAVIVTKTDLLPHLEYDMARAEESVRMVNPAAPIMRLSARTGEGIDAWYGFLTGLVERRGRSK